MAVTPACPIIARGVRLRHFCAGCSAGPSDELAFDRGQVLYRQGAVATRVFALTHGWVRVVVATPDGRQCAARLVGPGHVLGLEAFGPGEPTYLASADALKAVRACAVPIGQVRSWMTQHPNEALALTALAASDLAELQRRLVHNASLPAERRVLELVKDLLAGTAAGTWSELPATREQLGEVLGLTFETVSRMMGRLSARGLIEIDGRRVRILSPP